MKVMSQFALKTIVFATLLAVGGALFAGCQESGKSGTAEQTDANAKGKTQGSKPSVLPDRVTIPRNTSIPVRLLQTVSSRSANAGEEFAAELAAPVVANGKTVFAKGARVRGRVVSAKPSGRLKDPGFVRLTLDSIQSPDAKWVSVDTTSVTASGKSHKKRNLALIGGGAGLGAVVGGLAGGGKGAAIGAGVGAGAGTAGAYTTGKKDVALPAESKLSFKILREVALER